MSQSSRKIFDLKLAYWLSDDASSSPTVSIFRLDMTRAGDLVKHNALKGWFGGLSPLIRELHQATGKRTRRAEPERPRYCGTCNKRDP